MMLFITPRIDYSGENRILANEKLGKDVIGNLNNYEKTIEIPDLRFIPFICMPKCSNE